MKISHIGCVCAVSRDYKVIFEENKYPLFVLEIIALLLILNADK